MNIFNRTDIFNRITVEPALYAPENYVDRERLKQEMAVVDETGEVYYGADAFEVIFEKIPYFWPLALIYKIPGVIFVARYTYRKIATNRHFIGDGTCGIKL